MNQYLRSFVEETETQQRSLAFIRQLMFSAVPDAERNFGVGDNAGILSFVLLAEATRLTQPEDLRLASICVFGWALLDKYAQIEEYQRFFSNRTFCDNLADFVQQFSDGQPPENILNIATADL